MDQFELHISGADEFPDRLRMLVVGHSGSGKTHLATRFPNPLFACSGGDLTTLGQIGSVPFVNVSTLKDFFLLKKALDRPADEREELFGCKVETLVIDTIDELQRLLLMEHVKNEGRQETKGSDWGWVAERFHSMFTGLKQLDINLVVLARTKDVAFGDNFSIIQPALGGAFVTAIHEYVDISAYLTAYRALPEDTLDAVAAEIMGADTQEIVITTDLVEEVQRTLHFAPTTTVPWATDQTGSLPLSMLVDEDVVLNISERVSAVELTDSDTRTVEIPQPVVETEGEQDPPSGQYLCEGCGENFDEKTWADLSQIKVKKTLCSHCFKKTQ